VAQTSIMGMAVLLRPLRAMSPEGQGVADAGTPVT